MPTRGLLDAHHSGRVLAHHPACAATLILDLLPDAPRARVASDLGVAVEHAHDRLGGNERERLFYQRVRDRVVVFVEAQIRGFA